MVDEIARYWETVGDRRVTPAIEPGAVGAELPEAAPEEGSPGDWDAVFGDLERLITPNLTHWQHPGFMAYFPANASFPSILGELYCAGTAVQAMLWQTGPSVTELETRVMDWCADLFGLPADYKSRSERGGGVILGTASESTLVAMCAGRHRVLAKTGADPSKLTVYTSGQAHSSVMKAAMIAGIARGPDDHERVRLVPVDRELRMRPESLLEVIRADQAAGLVPAFVCATLGTTASTAVDPLEEIAGVVRASAPDAWLHCDAAFSGAACVCPEHRWVLAGIDLADSIVINAHKWMLTNFDCSLFFVRDRASLTGALSITPEYLRNEASEAGAAPEYRDWQVPLGRRGRAFKLWFVLRHYGAAGLRAYIREHVAWAAAFEERVRGDDRFEVAAPRTSSLVCLRLRAGEGATRALLRRVNESGRYFLSHAVIPEVSDAGEVLRERYVIRVAVGGVSTRVGEVDGLWELLASEADAVTAEAG